VGCIAGPSASEFHRNGRLDAARAAALAALPGWEWDGDVGGTRESLSRGLRFSIGAPVTDPPVSGFTYCVRGKFRAASQMAWSTIHGVTVVPERSDSSVAM